MIRLIGGGAGVVSAVLFGAAAALCAPPERALVVGVLVGFGTLSALFFIETSPRTVIRNTVYKVDPRRLMEAGE